MAEAEAEVRKANETFYHAFEKLDIGEMENVWLHEDHIQCFHPGWGLLRGWGPVMESWKRIFENTEQMRFTLTEIRVELRDSVAWVTLYENIVSRVGGQSATGVVLATNVFEKQGERWLMIHHHGSPVVQPIDQASPPTVH